MTMPPGSTNPIEQMDAATLRAQFSALAEVLDWTADATKLTGADAQRKAAREIRKILGETVDEC
jgi:hypothetical protein